MDNIYHELILDLYRHPLHKTKPEKFDISTKENNPLCGDTIEIFLKITDNQIEDIGWQGDGCAVSQASASILTDFLKGKSTNEIKKIGNEEILEMLKLKELNPSRLRCAALALSALKNGLKI